MSARDKFHVGQRVIWIMPPDARVPRARYTATVLEQRQWRSMIGARGDASQFVYPMIVDGFGTHSKRGVQYAAPEPELRSLYDGDQPASWEAIERLSGWSPRKSVARHG